MGFLRREKQIAGTICKECGMEFSETERMLRHMIKAHTKSGKGPSCNCQNFYSGLQGIMNLRYHALDPASHSTNFLPRLTFFPADSDQRWLIDLLVGFFLAKITLFLYVIKKRKKVSVCILQEVYFLLFSNVHQLLYCYTPRQQGKCNWIHPARHCLGNFRDIYAVCVQC